MSKIYYKAGNKKEKVYRWVILLLTILFVGGTNYLRWNHSEMTRPEFGKWVISQGGVWYFIGFLILMIFLWYKANETGIKNAIKQSKTNKQK